MRTLMFQATYNSYEVLCLCTLHVLLMILLKMQPVVTANADDLDYAARIQAAGTVSTVDTSTISFVILAKQYVAGSTDNIIVRVYMDQNPKWANPVKQLPRAKSVVKIDGRLLRFEQVSLAKSSALCVVIAAYDITYLVKPQQPSPSSGSGASTVATSQRKGNLRAKVQTQAESERSSQSQSTSSPVESQVKLGKRKANSSEDEVDDHV